jgi:hypothetical protein
VKPKKHLLAQVAKSDVVGAIMNEGNAKSKTNHRIFGFFSH